MYVQHGWDCEGLDKTDLHLHFPAGAVGKDGPSAGLAIAVALVSLFTGCCVRSDTAVTGEMTLRGLVLPVGCVVEKVLAARRAGVRHVILPHRNKKDLKDISDTVKVEGLSIYKLLHVYSMACPVWLAQCGSPSVARPVWLAQCGSPSVARPVCVPSSVGSTIVYFLLRAVAV